MSAQGARRARRRFPVGANPTGDAPVGTNRSSYGGDEIAEAFGMCVRLLSEAANATSLHATSEATASGLSANTTVSACTMSRSEDDRRA
jgi:hypothetical protein